MICFIIVIDFSVRLVLGWCKNNVVFDVQLEMIITPFIINFINRNKNH